MDGGAEINEWDAGQKLTAFRRENELFMGLAYENISASGPNAALPHYQPSEENSRVIDRETPYLKFVVFDLRGTEARIDASLQ
jgi:Xaa-Pro aminopeptidase